VAEATYHGKPCRYGHGTLRRHNNGYCVACQRESARAYAERRYAALTGIEYAHLLLQHRRTKALARMAERNERTTT
jgi:hypothetical protein